MGGVMNSSVFFVKQDLKFVDVLDTVTLTSNTPHAAAAAPLVVKGAKSMFKMVPTATDGGGEPGDDGAVAVLGTFGDGSPAAFKRPVGRGAAFYAGFLPGLSYYEPAIPVRPVDRSSVDGPSS